MAIGNDLPLGRVSDPQTAPTLAPTLVTGVVSMACSCSRCYCQTPPHISSVALALGSSSDRCCNILSSCIAAHDLLFSVELSCIATLWLNICITLFILVFIYLQAFCQTRKACT